ncbi:MAG: protein kinase [Proteobacteria bacterium]|nr:protein kinase [Pseudomonadota bacterium]
MPVEVGTWIGPYKTQRLLGSGSAGTVFLAQHSDGHLVAIKVVQTPLSSLAKRVRQEGQLLGRLNHPNIVHVRDVVDWKGNPCLVMEFVDGPTLAEHLAETRLLIEEVDDLGRQIIIGTARAHRDGLIHRDLNPANILLAPKDDRYIAKIADFGLAKAIGRGGGMNTRTGTPLGTPGYMSPEVINDAKRADQRADLFSVGAILYKMATGEEAFPGRTMYEVFQRVDSGEYTLPRQLFPDLPVRMEKAIIACLTRERTDRVANCEKLLSLWVGHPVNINFAVEPAPQQLKRTPSLLWLALGLLVAIVAGTGWALLQCNGADGEPVLSADPLVQEEYERAYAALVNAEFRQAEESTSRLPSKVLEEPELQLMQLLVDRYLDRPGGAPNHGLDQWIHDNPDRLLAQLAVGEVPETSILVAHYAATHSALRRGQLDEAEKALALGLALDFNAPALLCLAAELRLRRADVGGAIDILQVVLADEPQRVDARMLVVVALRELGETTNADEMALELPADSRQRSLEMAAEIDDLPQ